MLNLLKGKMAERGYNIQKVAAELGRSADYVSQKLRQPWKFRVCEAAKLCALLDIEPVEMHKYFVREDE